MDFKEYYEKHYDPKYFTLNSYELAIDPTETPEEVNLYDLDRQKIETIKCVNSFEYFCHKYIKILHPIKGLIPFVLFDYQRKVIKEYEKERFNIISKFRQGGLTTVTLLWGLWRCLFRLDQQIMLLSKTDREATDIGMMIDRAVEHLPVWLAPKKGEGKWNDHLKMVPDTGGALKFYSPEAARGKSVTFLIIDEAAFIPDMDKHWKAMWPVLSTGGSCVLISTVNGMGNWYEQTYSDAKDKRNLFNVIDLDYWEHPEYNNEKWVNEQKQQLGEKGFLQEVLREFLGSGETYIPSSIIREITDYTNKMMPIKKLFPQWVNKTGRAFQLESEDNKGALWIWKEPQEGREYIIGVDCADGMGEDSDNSSFQILDMETLEQVAEFYSNLVPPHIYSKIIHQVGTYYNTALVVVENLAAGAAVLSSLQNNLFYENIYFDTKKSGSQTIGFKVNRINRPVILEAMQSRILNRSIRLNSARLAAELQTFEYNPVTKKAEAQKRKHDDAISSLCIALYIRNQITQDLPVGAQAPQGLTQNLKDDVFEEIRKELLDSKYEDFIEEEISISSSINLEDQEILINRYRKSDKILKEFGW